jgi:cytochrome c553
MISSSPRFVSALAGALLGGSAACAAENGQGAQLAAMCAACHGPAGRSDGIPAIAGRDAEGIKSAMLAYRSSERPSHIMHVIATTLSDDEIAAVAAYLAAK